MEIKNTRKPTIEDYIYIFKRINDPENAIFKQFTYNGESIFEPIYTELLKYNRMKEHICKHCKGIVYEYGLHGEYKCVRCERVYNSEEIKELK